MPRDYKVYLDDMLDATAKIRDYTAGLTMEGLKDDSKTLDAVVRNLEIIGEATKKVPDEVRLRYRDVEWKKTRRFPKQPIWNDYKKTAGQAVGHCWIEVFHQKATNSNSSSENYMVASRGVGIRRSKW
jgi:uncharacterized protein with HEPN domain